MPPPEELTPAPTSAVPSGFPTLPEIKKAIPAKYFKADIPLSLYYVARSFAFVSLTAGVAIALTLPSSPLYVHNYLLRVCDASMLSLSLLQLRVSVSSSETVVVVRFFVSCSLCLSTHILSVVYSCRSMQVLTWLAYWAVQGTLFWGIFTLGHDCGHASFSKHKYLNQVFGNLLHSFLLVCTAQLLDPFPHSSSNHTPLTNQPRSFSPNDTHTMSQHHHNDSVIIIFAPLSFD
jgi:hypothetical protein